jgi:hypothetical protein
MIKNQTVRVKINRDSRNQTIDKLRGNIWRLAQVNKTDKSNNENITTWDKNM